MNNQIDIRPDQMKIVRKVLRSHLPKDANVWVFGSRASRTTKASSDLDLAIEGDSQIDLEVMGALEEAWEASDLPYTVDIVDLKKVSVRFRNIVNSQKVPLTLA